MAEKEQPKREREPSISTETGTDDDNNDGVGDCLENWVSDHREAPDDPTSVVNRIISRGAWTSFAKKFSAREVSSKPIKFYLIDDDGNFDKDPCKSQKAEGSKKGTSHGRPSQPQSSKATSPQQQMPQSAPALTPKKLPTQTATVSPTLPLPHPVPCKTEATQHKIRTARPQPATHAQARIATQQQPPQSSRTVKSPLPPEGLPPQSPATEPLIDEASPPIPLLDQARAVVERVHASGVLLDRLDEPPVEISLSRRPVVARSACTPTSKALQKKQLKERLKLQIKHGLERLNFGMEEWEQQDKALEELFRKKVKERQERDMKLKDCKFLLDSAAERVASIQTTIDPELTRQSLDTERHNLMTEIATFATKCKRETQAMAEENILNRRFKPRELMEIMKGQPGWSDPLKEKMREARWEYLNSIYELEGKTLELIVTKGTVAYGLVPIAYKFEDIEKKPPSEEVTEDGRESITARIDGRVEKLTVLSDEDLKKIQDLAIKGAEDEAEDNEDDC